MVFWISRLSLLIASSLFVFNTEGARIMPSTEPISRPELRVELLQMVEEDQAARRAQPIDKERLKVVDGRNTSRLKEIVKEVGWPTVQIVGTDGIVAAWLLAQHADLDRAFQMHVLGLMEEMIPAGRASGAQFAYLYDRVHTPQRYGTQGKCNTSGRWEPLEIEDPAAVDKRRADKGLDSLAEYAEAVSERVCATRGLSQPK